MVAYDERSGYRERLLKAEADLAEARAQICSLQWRLDKLQTKESGYKDEAEAGRVRCRELKKQRDKARAQIVARQAERDDAWMQLAQARKERDDAEARIAAKDAALAQKQAPDINTAISEETRRQLGDMDAAQRKAAAEYDWSAPLAAPAQETK